MRPAAARLAAAVALAAACPGPLAAAAPCPRYETRAWVTVPAPEFPAGPATVVDYVVSGIDPDRIYVTNGATVMATADGGCTWVASLAQPDLPVLGATPEITHLAAPANDPDVVYAALGSDAASRPGVLRTADGGRTWAAADRGLEAVQGRPLQLVVAPSRGDAAFLVVEGNRVQQGDQSAEVARSLFGTDNGGTWEERRASPLLVRGVDQQLGPVAVAGNGGFEGVTVDPRNSRVVWLYGAFGLWVSDDGARTGQQVRSQFERGGPTGHVDVFRSPEASRIAAFGSREALAQVSFDGGTTFFEVPTPGIVRSSATGRRFSELMIATDTQVLYQRDNDGVTEQVTPRGPAVRDLSVSRGAVPVFYARTTASLLRWTAAPDPPRPGDAVPPPAVPGDPTRAVIPRLPPLAAPSLRGPRELTLRPGERRTVAYTLDLPGVQRADLDFVVDVSDSMDDEINGLRSALAGIVSDLVASRIEARFGVARYNTYDSEPYFRITPVVAPGPALVAALDQLDGSEGGDQKSHLEAVLQSVTGRGGANESTGSLLNPGWSYHIAPGQQARFRPDVPVKIILNISDEGVYEGEPSPSYAEVGAALRAAGVLHVGLALDNHEVIPDTRPGPEVGLRRLAAESGALAPEGGVDCDGDATPDVEAGRPLVCVLPSERAAEATLLANAVVNLVRSIPNRGTVEFAVRPAAGAGAAPAPPAPPARLNRASVPVEFSRSVERRVEVTYACPAGEERDRVYRYEIEATSAGEPLAALATTLGCAPRPTGPPPVVRGVLPGVAAAVAPLPQGPSSHGNVNPNANPNPQSNPHAQAQLGAAAEPEEQDQAQVGSVDVREDDVEELAMSRRDPPPAPSPALLAGAALVASAAAAARLRARTRTRLRVRPVRR